MMTGLLDNSYPLGSHSNLDFFLHSLLYVHTSSLRTVVHPVSFPADSSSINQTSLRLQLSRPQTPVLMVITVFAIHAKPSALRLIVWVIYLREHFEAKNISRTLNCRSAHKDEIGGYWPLRCYVISTFDLKGRFRLPEESYVLTSICRFFPHTKHCVIRCIQPHWESTRGTMRCQRRLHSLLMKTARFRATMCITEYAATSRCA